MVYIAKEKLHWQSKQAKKSIQDITAGERDWAQLYRNKRWEFWILWWASWKVLEDLKDKIGHCN